MSPLEQAQINAKLRAADLGYLLGAIEAGHVRAGFNETQRLRAEEESVKAFTKLIFDLGGAPFPGPSKLLPGTVAPIYDALQSTILDKMKAQFAESGVPATEERLRKEFRENVTRFREIPTYLLPAESHDLLANDLFNRWQDTRDRVWGDGLNEPNQQ